MHFSTVEKRSAVQNLTKESTAAPAAAAAFSAVPDWVRRIFSLVEFRKKKIEKKLRSFVNMDPYLTLNKIRLRPCGLPGNVEV